MRLSLPQYALSDTPQRPIEQIAEVIQTSTTEFLSQCYPPLELKFPPMPAFASWVVSIDEESGNEIYGIVYYATTQPIDSVHRATALGMTIAQLKEEQPQIFAMLKTEFKSVIVGFRDPAGSPENNIFQYIPPRPPQIHQGVFECSPDQIIEFTNKLDFLRSLLHVTQVPVEGLIAAVIRSIYHLRKYDRSWLILAGRTLNLLLKDDYDRLRYILSQIH